MSEENVASVGKAEGIKVAAAIVVALVGLVCWGLAIATWGYPAIIIPALSLTVLGVVGLIFVTRG